MNELTPKERMAIPRQKMPEQASNLRMHNFEEVNLGLTGEQALIEARRCLDCKKPKCIDACPVNVQIPQFIMQINGEDLDRAAEIIREDNLFPAVCARVCPQENQCEGSCITGIKGDSVAIGNLVRFVINWDSEHGEKAETVLPPKTGKKIAVVGSGPAGLACSGDLIRKGHDVTVFEAFHALGGVLIYGIPEFRLPKSIVREEIGELAKLGVDFQTNVVIGLNDTVPELLENGYDAVFIGVGAGLPKFLNLPGEDLIGVYSANEFLTRVNLMKAYQFPKYDTPIVDCKGKNVAIFGGGNTAMDSVRVAKRLGAKNAYIIYRRSEAELPARAEEYHHAKEEGIEFMFLSNPLEFTGDEEGWLRNVKLQKMELGEPDDSGRRRPIPIEGSEYDLPIDVAIIAIGNGSNPIIRTTTPDLEFNKWGNIVVDPETMKTNMEAVYAGGDIVSGGATVILALGAGRKAAKAINEYLTKEN